MKSNNVLIKDFKNFDYGFLRATEAVFQSFGSEGKLCCIQKGQDPGYYTKDGVDICKAVRFSNLTASAGALAAITGCARSVSLTEDGTTLTSILMHSFVSKMDRSKFTKKVEAGIYLAVEEVYKHLEKLQRKASKKDLKQIALVATNSDPELSELITNAFDYAGSKGFVSLLVDKDLDKSVVEKQEGMALSNGFTSAYFSNREDKKIQFDGKDVGIMCCSIWNYDQYVVDKVQEFYKDKPRETPLIIFLEKSNSTFTEKLIGIRQVNYNVCVVACNQYDEYSSEELLNDIALYTGASVYNPRDTESTIVVGLANKVTSNVEGTTILNINPSEDFKKLVSILENAEKKDVNRIKRLTTKASLIRIGGMTPIDKIERFHRAEDGIGSVRSATLEGVIPGGGATLCHISGLMNTRLKHKEKQIGYDLVKYCMKQALIRLLKNGNRDQPKWYEPWKTDYVKASQTTFGYGYNSSSDELSNLEADGILDSKRTIRVAIESAVEQSIKVLNLGLIIHDPTTQTLD